MEALVVYGAPWCPDCRRSKAFLTEQRVPHRWVDVDADPASLAAMQQLQGGGRTIPTIVFPDGSVLIEPSNAELASRLGLTLRASRSIYDLLVIGGGPAGLTAAVSAAREGLDALVLDRGALGGQAGATERIDNYPGFPEGIRGASLAERLIAHARRYGVELLSGVAVERVRRESDCLMADTSMDSMYGADAVIVATGSRYRLLGIPGERELTGAGVHYCATCDGPFYRGARELVVVGGGNSALEEALFLAGLVDHVTVLARGDLRASALVSDRVLAHPRITVRTDTDVIAFEADRGRLAAIMVRHRRTGQPERLTPAAAFVFVGLDPNSGFLSGSIDLDPGGFVTTDATFQTSLEGVFAAGDVRAGSTKQIASAAGEGVAALLSVRHWLEARHLAAPRVPDDAEPLGGPPRP